MSERSRIFGGLSGFLRPWGRRHRQGTATRAMAGLCSEHPVVWYPIYNQIVASGAAARIPRTIGEARMADHETLVELAPIQDRDLLQRLSLYFDAVENRLRQGEGWLIFNASNRRSRRIAGFIQQRLSEHRPPVSYFLMPWRDFALSAFVTEVGMPSLAPSCRN